MAGDGGTGSLRITELSAAGTADGSARFLADGEDGRMRLGSRRADGSWTGRAVIAGVGAPDFRGPALAIAALPGGESRIAAIGLDGNVRHTVRGRGGDWTPFRPVPGPKGSGSFAGDQVAIAGLPDGSARLLVTTR
ncbi:hypothetical protein ACFXGI_31900 [Streptomyces sp. NPDC059355]|uniref:hypothetical protein n=1 Tax=Streptomyces sp. NPDC059355 TaxID=3346811 RepID=UPI003684DF0F